MGKYVSSLVHFISCLDYYNTSILIFPSINSKTLNVLCSVVPTYLPKNNAIYVVMSYIILMINYIL